MSNATILVTGASGNIGRGLVTHLVEQGGFRIVALDHQPLDESLGAKCHRVVKGDILDNALMESLFEEYDFQTIYHLAALLSTSAERNPAMAHRVNMDGTGNILEIAITQARRQRGVIKVLFTSSMAVYGMPDLEVKTRTGAVKESEWCTPKTIYGINKLFCEQLGYYYSAHYRQLDEESVSGGIDFRAIRFPGLLSAVTMPAGSSSDFVPEMLHHAIQGIPYTCFVREDTRIPFMVMSDAVKALLSLEATPLESLSQCVYNARAFNTSAYEFHQRLKNTFPNIKVAFKPHLKRQSLVDTWPEDLDDSAARRDWGWEPDYDLNRTLEEYLIPIISRRYQTGA